MAEQALYLRQPALSPDLSQIAFSYKGDIWKVASTGGRAVRLTIHPERDQRPVWSPDGRYIAFASQREGQSDIYYMPADGGSAKRLTYNTGADYPCDWSPDGMWILAETDRVNRPDLEEVPVSGGVPRPVTGVPEESEYFARYSADGHSIVYCDGSGATRWWWEGVKSGASGQVWILDHPSWPPKTRRVTPEGMQFLWPGFSGADVVATSNASGVVNLVRFKGGQGAPEPITQYTSSGVSWVSVSKDGSRAVFERNFRLWQIDLATDSVWEVVVEAPSDEVDLPRVEESIDGKIESFVLSKDGRKLAFVAGGEVYHMAAEKPKRAVRLTHTDAREYSPQFTKDGEHILYVSDRTGRQNLYSVDTRTGEEKTLTKFEKVDAARPQVSPRDGRVIFYLSNNAMASIKDDGSDLDTLLLGPYLDFPIETSQEFRLSPDGRYLAFSALGPDFNTDIWVHALEGDATVNMTRRSQNNHVPRWSPDGTWLTFQYSFNDQEQVYALRLLPKPPEFAETQLDSLYQPEKSEKKKDTTKTDSLPAVKIDFTDVRSRWQRIYPLAAAQSDLVATPDGKYWLMVVELPAGANIWKVAVDPESDDKPTQLTTGSARKSNLEVDGKSKWVYYIQDGKIGRVGMDAKDQELLSFAADYDYHPAERRKQKLTECWRMLSSYYYDPNMHGAKWDSLHQVFESILPHVALDDEWKELGRMFLGYLNSSHLDVYGGRPGLPQARQSGYLGLKFDPEAMNDGRYQVSRVVEGGPIDLAGDDVQPGAVLNRVNGVMPDSANSLDELLAGTIGKRVRMEFKSPKGDAFTVDVKPVSSGNEADLLYEEWVQDRRHLVDSLSNGRLGYVHIRSMNQPGLDRFQRELVDQSSTYEGLVLDVRFNGGGWISVHLLSMLERAPFLLRNFRGSQPTSESKMRSFALEKPGIMLMNQYSFSNAEIFAEGWRRLGMGKIVGYPTGAAVIGTAEYTLIDGSSCRRPSTGAFTLDMENLEGNPRKPDIQVFNTQADWTSGRDPQIEAAVTELLSELR